MVTWGADLSSASKSCPVSMASLSSRSTSLFCALVSRCSSSAQLSGTACASARRSDIEAGDRPNERQIQATVAMGRRVHERTRPSEQGSTERLEVDRKRSNTSVISEEVTRHIATLALLMINAVRPRPVIFRSFQTVRTCRRHQRQRDVDMWEKDTVAARTCSR